jgi:hypothetical protein
MKMSILVFWIVTPRGLVDIYQRFGGIYCLRLQDLEAVCSFETFVSTSTYQSTQCYNREDQHRRNSEMFGILK